MDKAYIYGIRNCIDNKIYIGSTKNAKARKYSHFRQLKLGNHFNIHLQRAYEKYKKNAFHFFIIEECAPESRYQQEVLNIKKFNSFNRSQGYNIYEPNDNKFKCSQATIDKLIQTNIDTKRSIGVDCYFLDNLKFYKSYDSIKQCGLDLNIKNSTIICNILQNKNNRLSYKGYTFFYKDQQPFPRISPKQRDMQKHHR